jgi:hypothetical protein
MVTRERRTPGRRYVDARWESPGWLYTSGATRYASRSYDASSRKDGIERLIREAVPEIPWNESEALADSVRNVR